MKLKDLDRYEPQQIKALCVQYWKGRKKAEADARDLQREIDRLNATVSELEGRIRDVASVVEGWQ